MNKILSYFLIFLPFIGFSQSVDSLDIKIGQMLMVGVSGTTIEENKTIKADIASGRIGGVLLFEKNINPENSKENLKRFISHLNSGSSLPLFVAVDQEGGLVNRLKTKYGFPKSVSAGYLGKIGMTDSTRYYAEVTATTLSGLGFNVNFAPVVDILVPNNPVIAKNERAYSANTDSTVLHASEVISAMRKNNIISVLKHFPGHGSSRDDSHYGIVDVTNYWSKEELAPYQKLHSSAMVDAVMSAHIVNKKLDKDGLPGTLSKDVIDGILRRKIGFNGVVFSDDMQMHAIAKYFGLKTALKRSINAGIDVLMFSNNIQGSENRTVDQVHALIRTMVEEGEISEKRIDESYERIKKLKAKYLN